MKVEVRLCRIDLCGREHAARGLCLMHYKQERKGKLGVVKLLPVSCTVDECVRAPFRKGMCKPHYAKAWREARPQAALERERVRAREYSAQQRAVNPEKFKQAYAAWYRENLEYARASGAASCKAWRIANPERKRATDRVWSEKNRDRVSEYRRKATENLVDHVVRRARGLHKDTHPEVVEVYRLIIQIKRELKK